MKGKNNKMKGKNLLILSISLLCSLGMITSCNTDEGSSTSTPTSQNSDSNGGGQTSTGGGTSQGSEEQVDHVDPYVTKLADGSITRAYKDGFDTMVEDFSSDLADTKTDGTKRTTPFLRVLVDSEDPAFPKSADAAIYKMATGTYEIQNYDTIGFRMRLVSGKLDLKNLVLALRGDDAYKVYELNLADCVDADGDATKALTSEFQDIKISPNMSIEDADVVYDLAAGGKSETKVLDKILGFHLYAKGNVSAEIEIEKVFIENAGTKTDIDTFARASVSTVDSTVWWRDSTGFIVQKGVNLTGGKYYQTPDFELGDNTDLVLNINGDTTGTKLVPMKGTTEGTAVEWKNLKNKDGVAIPNAVNGAYFPIAINLEQSGIDTTGLTSFKVVSTSNVNIATAFLTAFKDKEAVTEYPHLDTENAVIFDNFSRNQASFNDNYDASAADPTITGAGLNFAVSYSNGTLASVDGDQLVINHANGDDAYVNVKEGSKNGRTNQKYMVLSMKVEGEDDLAGLRIQGSEAPAVWSSNWFAGAGLPTIPTDMNTYPYKDVGDGFSYYIIDLEESGLNITDIVDIYYTGTAKLYIDSIFFANDYVELKEVEGYVEKPTESKNLTAYNYLGNVAVTEKTRYFEMTLQGDGTATFKSFRFGYKNETIYVFNNSWYTKDGTEITKDTVIPEESTTYIIDLAKSGVNITESETLHLHSGEHEGSTGTITISSIKAYNATYYTKALHTQSTEADFTYTEGDATYKYVFGGSFDGSTSMIALKLKGDGKVTLETFRLQYNCESSACVWANNGLKLYNDDGTPYDYTQPIGDTEIMVYIDLVESGFELTSEAKNIDLHFGGTTGTGKLTVVSTYIAEKSLPYKDVIANYNEANMNVED